VARMRKIDAVLLVALSGAWCFCFVLHLNQLARGGFAWIPIYVEPAPASDAHPMLRDFWPNAESLAPELLPGDSLESVGGRDLLGAGRLEVLDALYAGSPDKPIPVVAIRDGVRIESTLRLQVIAHAWRKTVVAVGFAVLGTLGFWRTRGSRVGRAYYLAMMAYAFHWTDFWGGSSVTTNAAVFVFGISTAFTAPLALRVALVFPEEASHFDGRARWWPWSFLVIGPVFTSWAFGLPFHLPQAGSLAVGLTAFYLVVLVSVLTHNYRTCGPRGKRQLKWVLLGFWVGFVPIMLTSLLALAAPELWWLYEASLMLALAVPICLFVALVRFNLFDVDRLLTAAATYSVIGTISLAGVFLIVPRASAAASGWIEPDVSQPALALALAGLALLGLRQTEARLESRLYPERRALEDDAGRLRRDLSDCEKPAEVLTALGGRLGTLLRLETVAIYANTSEIFAPVFARGPGICPSFDPEGLLATHLETFRDPLEPGRIKGNPLQRADWAALASMGVELVVPIALRGELAAFMCLGGKGSGDVFTATDSALLSGLADKAADELLHFEQADIERHTRELSEQLRNFVPSAIAREIDEGFRLDPGEREVSVLFVDIRGYTPFSEGQRPDAIFAAVSQYTETVSGVVDECGGSVVEFHGDGLMAVFGAPRPLEAKESCAIRAARAISLAIPELDVRGADGAAHHLDVGVGIATGSAYVGPLKTTDRVIWVALGNTTNLAARLEGSTRDLDVAVVVDSTTHAAAGTGADGFVSLPGLRVKGRSAPIDVFTWSRDVQENG
jgi:class 3 adenylate cyclase